MLNIIWISFFLAAFFTALFKLVFLGDQQVFAQIMEAMFSLAKSAFEISLGLTGVLALWPGQPGGRRFQRPAPQVRQAYRT